MSVSAIIVTRGDQPMQVVIDSLPPEWEILVWVNGDGVFLRSGTDSKRLASVPDLSVYGRYAAIEHASHDVIYEQDDDCIVSDPQAIVDAWTRIEVRGHGLGTRESPWEAEERHVVCNMPQQFRHEGYTDHALVGFGAAFHRNAPERAFVGFHSASFEGTIKTPSTDVFERTCDVVFTGLTPRVLVDVPYTDREFASGPDRMWKQPTHGEERGRMLELVRQVRGG